MKPLTFILSLAMFGFPIALNAAPLPLADGATRKAGELTKGGIVTGELIKGQTTYAAAGNVGVPDVPPERILFEIGSISKVFTGLVLAQAVVEGRVRLDTPIRELMDSTQKFTDSRVGDITLRQLATHTSGLPRLPEDLDLGANPLDPYAHYDRTRLNQTLSQQRLAGKPPFANAYSNFGVGLLGDLLARLYGKSWEQLIKEKVTQPLGLPDTVITLSEEQQHRLAPPFAGNAPALPWHLNALQGAGALHSTAADLITFGRALLHPEQTPMPKAIELLLSPQTSDGGIGLAISRSRLFGEAVYEHGGGTGGYVAGWFVLPERQVIQVVLINNTVLADSAVIAATREVTASPEAAPTPAMAELQTYPGIYAVDSKVRFTVVLRGNQLFAKLSGQAFLALYPLATAGRFFYKEVPAEIQFESANGKVKSLTLLQNGREVRANRTEETPPKILFRTEKELKPLAGTYATPGLTFSVVVRNGTLYVKLNTQPALPLFETQPNRFEYDVVTAVIEFDRDKEGTGKLLRLYQNGQIISAPRKP